MSRGLKVGLRLLASVPIALVIGGLGARILENGLWPLLLFPDSWLRVMDIATVLICQAAVFGALVWGWALERQ